MKRELFYIIRMKFIDSKSDYGIYVIKKNLQEKKHVHMVHAHAAKISQ